MTIHEASDVTTNAATAPVLPADLAGPLLAWYDRTARRLPWRYRDGAPPDPYRVWLSEIMLQQTTVVTVIPYYRRFVNRWPTVDGLAGATLDEVLGAWAGLGYYARARNLHRCAGQIVAAGGGWPDTEDALRKLPGIGAYTAAAIAAIVFDRPVAAIDGNVSRLIARLYAIDGRPAAARKPIAAGAQALVPDARSGDFAQALIELGATVCVPKAPRCDTCPWAGDCRARAQGLVAVLPRRPVRRPRPDRFGTVFWIERGDRQTAGHEVLLRARPPHGLLGGMIEFPSTPWTERTARPPDATAECTAPYGSDWRSLAVPLRHIFSHFRLELRVLVGRATGEDIPQGTFWWPVADLDRQALPSVMRKVERAVQEAVL